MGLPKKRSRKIVVDDICYRYIVTGNDDYIDLILEQEDVQGQRLTVSFRYHSIMAKTGPGTIQRNQITPVVVKRTIHYALDEGWTPNQKQKELRMNFIDEKVQLNLLTSD
ncbi:MAG: hypothetical protein AB8B56_12920 [Crocinitomicaceae bacterium]